uniref:Tryptophan synthase alpha chain n=1 Tax=Cumathamnion serrulatum TaxID=1206573 RepID=A0A7U1G3Z4_9FLOR|nr:tryptophane synthase alpha subunit [Cumathamnion serrulatum]QQY85297.1 tryptophane synthase alpha subunit [Cumathamnion serrulatum]
MKLISTILNNKRQDINCALIPFITAGYPSFSSSIEAIYTLDREGADIIELGVPYSDSLADGPLIQYSSKVALSQGIYIEEVLNILKIVTNKVTSPIIIFTYYNPILVRGLDKFIMEISSSGAKGLMIPDLPIEETDYMICLCSFYKIELILFIAPTSSHTRISSIIDKSPGCLYLVSSTGVTGMRHNINYNLNELSDYIKLQTNKLVMIGFGISNTSQASEFSQWDIDAIVIGSAFIKILSNQDLSTSDMMLELGIFCNSIKLAINMKNNN